MNGHYYILASTICFFINSYAAENHNRSLGSNNGSVVIDMHLVVENDQEYSPFDIRRMSRKNLFLCHAAGAFPTGFALDSYLQNTQKASLIGFMGWGCTGFAFTGGDLQQAINTGDIRRTFGSTDRFLAIIAGSAVGLLAGIGASACCRLMATEDELVPSNAAQPESLSTLQTYWFLQQLS